MNDATSFQELLSTSMDDIKRPPVWPAGTYHGVIRSHEFGESSKKKTKFVCYHIAITHAGADIDPEMLEGIELSKRDVKKMFYLSPDARYILKEFLESLGVEVAGRGLGQCIPEAINAQVLVAITQRNSEDGRTISNDVGNVWGETD